MPMKVGQPVHRPTGKQQVFCLKMVLISSKTMQIERIFRRTVNGRAVRYECIAIGPHRSSVLLRNLLNFPDIFKILLAHES